MKQLFLIAILSFLVIACKKHVADSSLLTGTWELEQSYNMSGAANYPAGNGALLIFTQNGNMEYWKKDTLLSRRSYHLIMKKDCYERESDLKLVVDDPSFESFGYISFPNGKLSIGSSNCVTDPSGALYHKLP